MNLWPKSATADAEMNDTESNIQAGSGNVNFAIVARLLFTKGVDIGSNVRVGLGNVNFAVVICLLLHEVQTLGLAFFNP